ncbi:unnamed protein product [Symbiodinium pilosum]|uniref:Uncharacterized protein n=1 Tax=Symbiodinium pilosum TaxID=2952 RepID=A0A812U3G4_SYMPI|nr:unnamed protein product [Symbiodinium pilosum]
MASWTEGKKVAEKHSTRQRESRSLNGARELPKRRKAILRPRESVEASEEEQTHREVRPRANSTHIQIEDDEEDLDEDVSGNSEGQNEGLVSEDAEEESEDEVQEAPEQGNAVANGDQEVEESEAEEEEDEDEEEEEETRAKSARRKPKEQPAEIKTRKPDAKAVWGAGAAPEASARLSAGALRELAEQKIKSLKAMEPQVSSASSSKSSPQAAEKALALSLSVDSSQGLSAEKISPELQEEQRIKVSAKIGCPKLTLQWQVSLARRNRLGPPFEAPSFGTVVRNVRIAPQAHMARIQEGDGSSRGRARSAGTAGHGWTKAIASDFAANLQRFASDTEAPGEASEAHLASTSPDGARAATGLAGFPVRDGSDDASAQDQDEMGIYGLDTWSRHAATEPKAKRSRGSQDRMDAVQQRCATVAQAIGKAQMPQACRAMLEAAVPLALGVSPADRDKRQVAFARFIGEVLKDTEALLLERLLQEKRAAKEEVLAAATCAQKAAKAVRDILTQVERCEEQLAVHLSAEEAAKLAHGCAEVEANEAEAARSAAEVQRLERQMEQDLSRTACSVLRAENKELQLTADQLSKLQKVCNKLNLEDSLLCTLPLVLQKPVEGRSPLEEAASQLITKALEDYVEATSKELTCDTLTSAEEALTERAKAAQADLNASCASLAEARENVLASQAAASSSSASLRQARVEETKALAHFQDTSSAGAETSNLLQQLRKAALAAYSNLGGPATQNKGVDALEQQLLQFEESCRSEIEKRKESEDEPATLTESGAKEREDEPATLTETPKSAAGAAVGEG